MKKIPKELDIEDAKSVFMIRFRMLPTRMNFQVRWNTQKCSIMWTEWYGQASISMPTDNMGSEKAHKNTS